MVTNYISLLRGINVGGHRKISMPGLQKLYLSLGFSAVQTYIQSGNAVFRFEESDKDQLAETITNAITREFNLDVPVVIRSASEWKQVVVNNPFLLLPPETLHVLVLSGLPLVVAPECKPEDEKKSGGKWHVAGREIYLHCPHGFSKFKFPPALTEKHLGVNITARNWNTAMKLNEMADRTK